VSIGIVPWIMTGTPVRGTPSVGPRGSIYKYLVRSPRRRRIGRRRCGNSNLDRKTSGTCRRTRSGPRGRHRCSRSTLHLEGVARGDRRQSPPIRRAHRTARSWLNSTALGTKLGRSSGSNGLRDRSPSRPCSFRLGWRHIASRRRRHRRPQRRSSPSPHRTRTRARRASQPAKREPTRGG
jgi:hypothetical protein